MSEDVKGEDVKLVGGGNKNIWLAIALAMITSITSLGTAFFESVSKKSEDKVVDVGGDLKTEFKVFEEKVNRDIKELRDDFEEDDRISSSYKVIATGLNNSLNKKMKELEDANKELLRSLSGVEKRLFDVNKRLDSFIKSVESDSFSRDISMKKEIDINTRRSIICYASLTEEELKRGRGILGILNGEGMNKNLGDQKMIDKLVGHLEGELLKYVK